MRSPRDRDLRVTWGAELADRLRSRGYTVDVDSEGGPFLIVSGEGLDRRPISRRGAEILAEGLVTLHQLVGQKP